MRRLLILVWVISGISCSEEKIIVPYEFSKVFTGEIKKTWKVKFFEETLDGKVIDTFNVACGSDDLYTFHNDFDHTFEAKTGSNKCNNPPEADTIKDIWTFSNASSTLTMILPLFDPETRLPFIVREVNKDNMELEIFFDGNASSYRIHFDVTDED